MTKNTMTINDTQTNTRFLSGSLMFFAHLSLTLIFFGSLALTPFALFGAADLVHPFLRATLSPTSPFLAPIEISFSVLCSLIPPTFGISLEYFLRPRLYRIERKLGLASKEFYNKVLSDEIITNFKKEVAFARDYKVTPNGFFATRGFLGRELPKELQKIYIKMYPGKPIYNDEFFYAKDEEGFIYGGAKNPNSFFTPSFNFYRLMDDVLTPSEPKKDYLQEALKLEEDDERTCCQPIFKQVRESVYGKK